MSNQTFGDIEKSEGAHAYFAALEAIVDSSPFALNLWDLQMNNIACNKQVLGLFQIEDREEFRRDFFKFSPEYQPNGILSTEMVKRNMETVIQEGYHKFKWMHINSAGEEIPAEISLTKIDIPDDQGYVIGFVRDLRPEFEQGGQDSDDDFYFPNRIPEKTLLRKVAEISDELFFSIDRRTTTIQFLSPAVQESYFEMNDGKTTPAAYDESIIHPDDIPIYQGMVANMRSGITTPVDLRFIYPDGSTQYHRIIYRFVKSKEGPPIVTVGKVINVHEQKMLEKRVKFDSLTPCYSKHNAKELISARLECDKSCHGALLFIDINGFKAFNETNGYFYGDELLRQLTKRMQAWSDEKDIVGRIGGDQFVVYIDNAYDNKFLEKRLDNLIEDVSRPYLLQDITTCIQVSIGVVLCNEPGVSYENYMYRANKALYMAKIDDKANWMYYSDAYENLDCCSTPKFTTSENISGLVMDHTISSTIFNILYEGNSEKPAIDSALRYLGHSYDACRCFIAESFDGGKTYSCTHEWHKPDVNSHMQSGFIATSDFLQELFDSSAENGIYVCGDINNCSLSQNLCDHIAGKSTTAFLHSQIKKDDAVTFFLGVEVCGATRTWTDTQINTLHYMSRLFSIILLGNHLDSEVKILSEHSKISAFIGDNTDNFIYIVDPDTYDMLHMNRRALEMYGNPTEQYWRSKKCYELLHGKTQPCEFCTNEHTTQDKFYEWKYYNPRFNKTYLFKDKLVRIGEKLVKLQVATDITNVVTLETQLHHKLSEQTLLLSCIQMLHSDKTPNCSIETILSYVCEFFGASRGMIMQISMDRLTVNCTQEWVGDGSLPKRAEMQHIPLNAVSPFFDIVSQEKALYITDLLEKYKDHTSLYNIFKTLDLQTMICAPIIDTDGKFIGTLGIDNPTMNMDKHWLCASLSAFISDFLSKNKLVDSLNRLSYYDELTGAKNRHSYRKALDKINSSDISSLGVAYVDIKGLARINERKGIRYGDEVVRKLWEILSEIFDDDIFRVGGDEFVVLQANIEELLFEENINVLREAIHLEPDLNASIGYTWNSYFDGFEFDGDKSYDTVLGSRNYSAILSKNLDNEIKSGKYVVFLQPQIDLATNKLNGAEALIRRIDAGGNIQPPMSFVPFYEKEGMISKIDLYVFRTVCGLLSKWNKNDDTKNMKISVNFSRATIMEIGIISKLTAICDEYSLSRSKFVVEITETISHTDDNIFTMVMASLKDAGFCISLDDFGSGHSNLSSLNISNFDEIKIDMGLTRNLHTEPKSRILTKVALNLCEEFEGTISVAEGIETQEQLDILRELGCHTGQGYYFSRPISIEDFEAKYINDPN